MWLNMWSAVQNHERESRKLGEYWVVFVFSPSLHNSFIDELILKDSQIPPDLSLEHAHVLLLVVSC